MQAEPALGEILVSAEDLQRRVAELGEEITRDYAGRAPLLVGVLKGAVFFLSDLRLVQRVRGTRHSAESNCTHALPVSRRRVARA